MHYYKLIIKYFLCDIICDVIRYCDCVRDICEICANDNDLNLKPVNRKK